MSLGRGCTCRPTRREPTDGNDAWAHQNVVTIPIRSARLRKTLPPTRGGACAAAGIATRISPNASPFAPALMTVF